MLTRKQRELLDFIGERLATDAVSPSFEEMKEALGLKSKSGVHRLVSALVERGFVRRIPNRARALQVVENPQFAAPPSRQPAAHALLTATTDELIAELRRRHNTTLSLPARFIGVETRGA